VFVPLVFREDIASVGDLKPGMTCPGVVTNVTNFGAFVDIGVHQDGLVHISQLANRFVKDPRDVVSPGDRVSVRVLEVNTEKKQIALTMRSEAPAKPPEAPKFQRKEVSDKRVQSPRPRVDGAVGERRPHEDDRSRGGRDRRDGRPHRHADKRQGHGKPPVPQRSRELVHNPFAILADKFPRK
jgi:uncharacterized protein